MAVRTDALRNDHPIYPSTSSNDFVCTMLGFLLLKHGCWWFSSVLHGWLFDLWLIETFYLHMKKSFVLHQAAHVQIEAFAMWKSDPLTPRCV